MQWRNWIARHRKSVVTTAVIVALVPVWVLTLTVVTGQSAKDDWVYVPNCNVTHTTKDAASSGDDDSEPSAPAGGGGDWLTKGTEQYKTAVEVGKWWKNKGASASGIWGVMGNVAQESRFVYNIYQNGGTRDDPLNIHGSIGTNGWGLYQISPGDRLNAYGYKKSDGIKVKPQSIWAWHQALERSGGIYLPPLAESHSIEDQTKNFYGATENAVSTFNAGQGAERIGYAKQAKDTFAKEINAPSTGNKSKLTDGGGGSGSNAAGGDDSDSSGNNSKAAKYDQYGCPVNKTNGDGGPAVAGKWTWPFKDWKDSDVSSGFGPRSLAGSAWHDGIDIGTATNGGQDIVAVHGGTVKEIGCKGTTQLSIGYYIAIESPDGYSEIYQEFAFSEGAGKAVTKVKVGDKVKTGQPIAKLDPSTPNCTHLHLGVYKGNVKEMMSKGQADWQNPNGNWQDPVKIIKKGLDKSDD